MRAPAAISLFLLLAVLIAPAAAAEELCFVNSRIVSVDAPEDMVISSLKISNLPPGGNISLNLNAYGQLYLLQVTTHKDWGWWNFDVSCTYPNGTTASQHLSSLQPFAGDYDLTLQPYWIPGSGDWLFDIDINVALLPLTATFQDSYNPTKVQVLAFSQVLGTLTEPGDVIVYLASRDEFEDQQKNNPITPIIDGAKTFFAWSWDALMDWIGKIPGIGPLFVSGIEITVTIVTEIVWWFYVAFQYRNLLILLVEFWIISDALSNTKSLFALLRRIVQNHIRIAEGIIWLTETTVGLILKVVQTVAAAVNALKPI